MLIPMHACIHHVHSIEVLEGREGCMGVGMLESRVSKNRETFMIADCNINQRRVCVAKFFSRESSLQLYLASTTYACSHTSLLVHKTPRSHEVLAHSLHKLQSYEVVYSFTYNILFADRISNGSVGMLHWHMHRLGSYFLSPAFYRLAIGGSKKCYLHIRLSIIIVYNNYCS